MLYSRTGRCTLVGPDGLARWQVAVPDDRSSRAIARDDRRSTSRSDAAVVADVVVIAARSELISIDRRTGMVRARTRACPADRGVVLRLVALGDNVVATCGRRTELDDELVDRVRSLDVPLAHRDGQPTIEDLRTGGGDVVAYTSALEDRWRVALGSSAHATHVAPVAVDDDAVAVVVRGVEGAPAQVGLLDGATGRERWRATTEFSDSEPVVGRVALWYGGGVIDLATGRAEPATVQPERWRRTLFVLKSRVLALDASGLVEVCPKGPPRPVHATTPVPPWTPLETSVATDDEAAYVAVVAAADASRAPGTGETFLLRLAVASDSRCTEP